MGGGILGLSVAHELHKRGRKDIVILEKEDHLGVHASGRNSGVLHAGIYYSSDSLKAKFCSRGAHLLKDYAQTHDVNVHTSGKVIVASKESELSELEALYQRSLQNKIRVEKINENQLQEIEPAARTVSHALYSPDTAVINPKEVLEALRSDLVSRGVIILTSQQAMAIQAAEKVVITQDGSWSYGHLINTAGLQADWIAHQMGVGMNYRVLPFRGRYRKLRKEVSGKIRGLIYPVPDPRLPFLGVHLTKGISGDVWVGPTAEPALGRENYKGLGGIDWAELPRLLTDLLSMTLRNASGLTAHILSECQKQLPGGLLSAVQQLVPSLVAEDFTEESKTGLRAQLLDTRNLKLVMDFVVEKGPSSTHVLNAVSPGFTASFSFAEHIVNLALDNHLN